MSYEKMMKWNRNNRKGIPYKRGYVGFNPSGITSEEMTSRNEKFVAEMKDKTREERIAYWENAQKMQELRAGFSWEWEWCAFQRNFVNGNEVI